jgi:hypothetical protein
MLSRLLCLLMLILSLAAPAQAEWREVETKHFRIVGEASEKELVRYAERLEGVHYLMKIATGMRDDRAVVKVKVTYVADENVLHRVMGVPPKSPFVGVYVPGIEGPQAIVARTTSSGDDAQNTLFHEYAHHFMLQYQAVAYPPWYVEGWAELVSTASFERKGSITFGKAANHRQWEIQDTDWIPLEQLMSRPAKGKKSPRSSDNFYGQSWLLAHYLTLSDKRPGQLRAYLSAINSGKSDEEAFAAFGDMKLLEREFRAYGRAGSFPYKAPPLPPEVLTIIGTRTLRPGEAELVEQGLRARFRMDSEQRAKLIAEVEAVRQRHPREVTADLLLAGLNEEAEDWTAMGEAAARARASDPGNARTATLYAIAEIRRLDSARVTDPDAYARARAPLAEAVVAAPDDPFVLANYYYSYGLAGERGDEAARLMLVKASDLSPQDQGLRLTAAELQIRSGDLIGALRRLRPVAYGPHSSWARRRAQDLLVWLGEGAVGDPPRTLPDGPELSAADE